MTERTPATLSALASDELAQLAGGVAPGWWWFFMFLASESEDFVEGLKDGYHS